MIYVATYIDVQPASKLEAATLLKLFGESTRTESGNLWTEFMQESSRTNRFVLIEAWENEASLQAHEQSFGTTSFRSNLKSIQNSPNDRRVHLGFATATPKAAPNRGAVFVVTHVDVPPPRREETEALLRNLVEPSRIEDGNLRYDVFQQLAPRTNHFTVFATWKDPAAFDSHEAKPHTRAFREALGPMLGAPYDERLYGAL